MAQCYLGYRLLKLSEFTYLRALASSLEVAQSRLRRSYRITFGSGVPWGWGNGYLQVVASPLIIGLCMHDMLEAYGLSYFIVGIWFVFCVGIAATSGRRNGGTLLLK